MEIARRKLIGIECVALIFQTDFLLLDLIYTGKNITFSRVSFSMSPDYIKLKADTHSNAIWQAAKTGLAILRWTDSCVRWTQSEMAD